MTTLRQIIRDNPGIAWVDNSGAELEPSGDHAELMDHEALCEDRNPDAYGGAVAVIYVDGYGGEPTFYGKAY